MKSYPTILFIALALLGLSSCETETPNDPNTERFYIYPWNTTVERQRDEIMGFLSAVHDTVQTTATLTRSGNFEMLASVMGDHQYQRWSYSWSTDKFYMNWSPCVKWFINEEADSMYLEYSHWDYDPGSGQSFNWDYKLYMTR